MYICDDCKLIFDEPKDTTQSHQYGDTTADESMSECPHCGGSYSEAKQCTYCDEYTDDLNEGLCPACWSDVEVLREELAHYKFESASKEKSYLEEFNLCKKTVREHKNLVALLENTEIWFISWLNNNVCSGKIIGYETDNGGYVVATDNSMISAENIYKTQAEAQFEADRLNGVTK